MSKYEHGYQWLIWVKAVGMISANGGRNMTIEDAIGQMEEILELV